MSYLSDDIPFEELEQTLPIVDNILEQSFDGRPAEDLTSKERIKLNLLFRIAASIHLAKRGYTCPPDEIEYCFGR